MSRVGASDPSFTGPPLSAWAITVGITARADWRGPKVLKGRMMATGRPKERQ